MSRTNKTAILPRIVSSLSFPVTAAAVLSGRLKVSPSFTAAKVAKTTTKKMPGYGAKTVEPMKAALICPECNLLLRDAVQTGDGIRLCETCFKQFQE